MGWQKVFNGEYAVVKATALSTMIWSSCGIPEVVAGFTRIQDFGYKIY